MGLRLSWQENGSLLSRNLDKSKLDLSPHAHSMHLYPLFRRRTNEGFSCPACLMYKNE